jgi:hypothetical protein
MPNERNLQKRPKPPQNLLPTSGLHLISAFVSTLPLYPIPNPFGLPPFPLFLDVPPSSLKLLTLVSKLILGPSKLAVLLLLLYVKLVLTVSGLYALLNGLLGVIGVPLPASGVFRLNWIKERFLSGGGGVGLRGRLKRKVCGGERGEGSEEEPFEVRFISSQPLFIGIEGDFLGEG